MRGQHNIAVKNCLRILELMLINSGVQMVNISYFGLNICVCVLLPIYMSILFNFLSYSDFLMSSQHVLERGKPQERSQILSKLSGHIVLLWLILLLRLRRSIVDVCSISFRLFNCFRLLHIRAKVCVVVGRGA